MPRPFGKPCAAALNVSCSTRANAESATTDYPEGRSLSKSNLDFQPDWSCRLPSLLIRDQAGCPFDDFNVKKSSFFNSPLICLQAHRNLHHVEEGTSPRSACCLLFTENIRAGNKRAGFRRPFVV